MNQNLAKAIAKYEEAGTRFTDIFNWHLCYGAVLCHPDYFAMAYFCDSSDPEQPILPCDKYDCVYFTWGGGCMRSIFEPFLDRVKYVAFQRETKGSEKMRVMDIRKMYSKLK